MVNAAVIALRQLAATDRDSAKAIFRASGLSSIAKELGEGVAGAVSSAVSALTKGRPAKGPPSPVECVRTTIDDVSGSDLVKVRRGVMNLLWPSKEDKFELVQMAAASTTRKRWDVSRKVQRKYVKDVVCPLVWDRFVNPSASPELQAVQLANATRDVGKVCASSSSGRVTAITLTEDQRSELEKTLAYKVTLLTMAHKVPVRIRHELNRLYKEVSSEFLDSLRLYPNVARQSLIKSELTAPWSKTEVETKGPQGHVQPAPSITQQGLLIPHLRGGGSVNLQRWLYGRAWTSSIRRIYHGGQGLRSLLAAELQRLGAGRLLVNTRSYQRSSP